MMGFKGGLLMFRHREVAVVRIVLSLYQTCHPMGLPLLHHYFKLKLLFYTSLNLAAFSKSSSLLFDIVFLVRAI